MHHHTRSITIMITMCDVFFFHARSLNVIHNRQNGISLRTDFLMLLPWLLGPPWWLEKEIQDESKHYPGTRNRSGRQIPA